MKKDLYANMLAALDFNLQYKDDTHFIICNVHDSLDWFC